MKPKKLGDLWKRQDELRLLISTYNSELKEVEKQISSITGEPINSYEQLYDDEAPDSIMGTEDGI